MSPVAPLRVLAELESIAARVGIAVRAEPFGSKLLRGRGGLCWVHGRPLVVMDSALSTVDRIPLLAGALAHFELEGLAIAPRVRAILDAARDGHSGPRLPSGPGTEGKPGLARTRPKRG